jgi:hypothetical protein
VDPMPSFCTACAFSFTLIITVNTTTSSRFLINGKNIQIFVDRDLKNIRKIIESATQNNTEALLKNLNVKMAEQLTKLLQAGLVDK